MLVNVSFEVGSSALSMNKRWSQKTSQVIAVGALFAHSSLQLRPHANAYRFRKDVTVVSVLLFLLTKQSQGLCS
jgi:hypothetical protein